VYFNASVLLLIEGNRNVVNVPGYGLVEIAV
jgi:hypothetical protein